MANLGFKNSNNSQFFITTVECPHLDQTNVAFGEVIKGMGVVHEMEKYTTDDAMPTKV
jgi:cyclophilin family peptidyl-prolyl cis-trans isomerase